MPQFSRFTQQRERGVFKRIRSRERFFEEGKNGVWTESHDVEEKDAFSNLSGFNVDGFACVTING